MPPRVCLLELPPHARGPRGSPDPSAHRGARRVRLKSHERNPLLSSPQVGHGSPCFGPAPAAPPRPRWPGERPTRGSGTFGNAVLRRAGLNQGPKDQRAPVGALSFLYFSSSGKWAFYRRARASASFLDYPSSWAEPAECGLLCACRITLLCAVGRSCLIDRGSSRTTRRSSDPSTRSVGRHQRRRARCGRRSGHPIG